ncbi:MAG: hypothetical protein AABY02_04525, partial [Nanoarchaeota archaeon]
FHYPKLVALALAIVTAYIIFTHPAVIAWFTGLEFIHRKWVAFIAGMLIAFGFTAPFGIGLLITLNPANLWLASFIGALGAVFADILIFKTIRMSFMDEFKRLEKTSAFEFVEREFHRDFKAHVRNYLLYIFAGLVIASPLPDEVGVVMLAGLTRIRPFLFIVISFTLHLIGIAVILHLG